MRLTDGTREPFRAWLRPHARRFLAELFEIVDHVGIYSSASERYVKAIVRQLGLAGKVVFAASRVQCILKSEPSPGDIPVYTLQKSLATVMEMPGSRKANLAVPRTLIVDDSLAAVYDDRFNAILVSPFFAGATEDRALLDALEVIRQIRASDVNDVRRACKCYGSLRCIVTDHRATDENRDPAVVS